MEPLPDYVGGPVPFLESVGVRLCNFHAAQHLAFVLISEVYLPIIDPGTVAQDFIAISLEPPNKLCQFLYRQRLHLLFQFFDCHAGTLILLSCVGNRNFFLTPSFGFRLRSMKNSGLVNLGELISPGSINLNLKSKDRESVLLELVNQIPELAQQPDGRETLLKALHEREQLHSTGIGDGIALPHARNALVGLVDHPIIVFARHPQGIPYGALDDLPARLFFLLIAPTVTQHLAILARLSRLLRDPKVRQALLSAENPGKVISLIKEAEARM
jgi:nitrogen PTS system EIIA component